MADFQKRLYELTDRGADVLAGSSDDVAGAEKIVEELGLEFPVLYGLDPEETSEKIGSYAGERDGKPHIQPAAFLLDGSGRVRLATYSSDKVGRLTPQDVLDMLD